MATVYKWAGLRKALVINLISRTFWSKPIYFTVTWSRREAVTIIDRSKLLTGGKGGSVALWDWPCCHRWCESVMKVNGMIDFLIVPQHLSKQLAFPSSAFFSLPPGITDTVAPIDLCQGVMELDWPIISTGCFSLHLFMLNCPPTFRSIWAPSLAPCADRHVAERPKCALSSQRASPAALKYQWNLHSRSRRESSLLLLSAVRDRVDP